MTTSPSPQQPADPPTESHHIVPIWQPAVDPGQFARALVLIAEDTQRAKGRKSKTKPNGKTRPTKPKKGSAS